MVVRYNMCGYFVNCYASDAFLELKMHQNWFSAKAPEPAGELTALLRPRSRLEKKMSPLHCFPLDRHLRRLNLGTSIDSTVTSFSTN